MTTRPAAQATVDSVQGFAPDFTGRMLPCDDGRWIYRSDALTVVAADRADLLYRVRRVHYPPQIGTHYEQGFADCLRAVLAEFERL